MQSQPNVPWMEFPGGLNTTAGMLLPPGGRVAAFVRSGGRTNNDPVPEQYPICTTMQAAFAKCRASQGDIIYVLPGHTESITGDDGWSSLLAGTQIIGIGHGTLKPTFNFTATTSQLDLDVANVGISGCRFNLDGANGVVKGLNITGADVSLVRNEFLVASATNLHCEIAVEIGTAAHRCKIIGNKFWGIVGEPITDGILVAGVAHDFEIAYNQMQFASTTSTTASLIRVGAVAALRGYIGYNRLFNTVAASDYAIVLGAAASQGIVEENRITVLTNDVPTGLGISFGAGTLWGPFNNRVTTNVNVSGELTPVVDA